MSEITCWCCEEPVEISELCCGWEEHCFICIKCPKHCKCTKQQLFDKYAEMWALILAGVGKEKP